jgi:hypothetical protein
MPFLTSADIRVMAFILQTPWAWAIRICPNTSGAIDSVALGQHRPWHQLPLEGLSDAPSELDGILVKNSTCQLSLLQFEIWLTRVNLSSVNSSLLLMGTRRSEFTYTSGDIWTETIPSVTRP